MKLTLLSLLILSTSALAGAENPESQIDRGRRLFLNSPKGTACATCHALENQGASIGPDLTRLACIIGPRGLVTTIQMTMTAYVQEIRLRNGRDFPGIQKQKEGNSLQVFDLSKTPPALLHLNSAEVVSMKTNSKWTHPPTAAGYSPQELADLIAYLKCAATGVAKEVSTDELK